MSEETRPSKLSAAANYVAGTVKETVGSMLGAEGVRSEGAAQKMTGSVESKAADVKEGVSERAEQMKEGASSVGERMQGAATGMKKGAAGGSA